MADLIALLRALQKVAGKVQEIQCQSINTRWRNSSLNQLPAKVGQGIERSVSTTVVKQAQFQVLPQLAYYVIFRCFMLG